MLKVLAKEKFQLGKATVQGAETIVQVSVHRKLN
jgi:hypothetical protein